MTPRSPRLQLPVPLGSTATIDHPTPDALATHISTFLAPASSAKSGAGAGAAGSGAAAAAALESARAMVASAAEEILGSSVDAKKTFMAQGMDSLTLIELANALQEQLPVPLGSTATIDHPTPDALAAHIAASLMPATAARTPLSVGVGGVGLPSPMLKGEEQLGVGGLSLALPGDARDAQQLWQVLCTTPDTRVEIPASRFDVGGGFYAAYSGGVTEGRSYNKAAHLLSGVELFDAAAFGVSPGEVAQMDPQQRLLLEGALEAACGGGFTTDSLHNSSTGTFLGLGNNDWAHLQGRRDHAATIHTVTGHSVSIASGRIAFQLGCLGPAVTSDTACSSSTVALDQGLTAIRMGRCDQALCGGVNLLLLPSRFVELSQAHPHGPKRRLGGAMSGHHGLPRLHVKA